MTSTEADVGLRRGALVAGRRRGGGVRLEGAGRIGGLGVGERGRRSRRPRLGMVHVTTRPRPSWCPCVVVTVDVVQGEVRRQRDRHRHVGLRGRRRVRDGRPESVTSVPASADSLGVEVTRVPVVGGDGDVEGDASGLAPVTTSESTAVEDGIRVDLTRVQRDRRQAHERAAGGQRRRHVPMRVNVAVAPLARSMPVHCELTATEVGERRPADGADVGERRRSLRRRCPSPWR